MASTAEATRILEEIGISQNSRLVVYFTGNNVSTTTRTIYSLMYFGFEGRVALLDGGLDGWKRAGGSVTNVVPEVRHTSLQLSPHPDLVVDAEYVRQHLDDVSVTIVDARSKNFYDGAGTGPRLGHIKGAVSVPYSSVADTLNQFKSKGELETIFRDAGVKKGNTIVAYCHVGQQATVVLQAARLLGYQVKLYDGSYEEWPNLDDARYPVEKTPVNDKP
jgi:thiosulfate/3-mercaptopyruvate sulfurtransferase